MTNWDFFPEMQEMSENINIKQVSKLKPYNKMVKISPNINNYITSK